MKPTLYFSRNPNPRLAVAAAKHLNAPVTYEFAAPLAPGQADKFKPLNPSLRVPILVETDGRSLWEADAIACRLSQLVGSDFWRAGAELPDMIRWVSWSRDNFMHACDMVHFERGTKLRYSLGALNEGTVARGIERFHETASILNAHLSQQDWLLASGLSYADFRMGVFLPYNDVARLPLSDYPALQAWHDRLMALPAWADPFEGLAAPELPPIP
ncbi:glutathione S-transferase family protein [Roseateles sp. NT4]|uniref:glutathione S-transferase family protein n=1 Tax=Roseateles sp. NT4 TaxID=3453715 RepID=UPI003EEDD370